MMEDQLIGLLPVHFSNAHSLDVQIHQYPVLSRSLQFLPSSSSTCPSVQARIKPKVGKIEVHVPVDTRPEVWNVETAKVLGTARAEDDRDKNQEIGKGKEGGDELILKEVRMQSERTPPKGAYMLAVVRGGRLHLHPIAETHQLRPSMSYLDILSRKSKHSKTGDISDSDSNDGPPLDPDELPQKPAVKQEKKPSATAKEAQVSARKPNDKGDPQPSLGGLSSVRREILSVIRMEQEEVWENLEYCSEGSEESTSSLATIFSDDPGRLDCKYERTAFLKSV